LIARRGVSEIVASLMILLTVTSLSVVLYNYALSSSSSQTYDLIDETKRQEYLAQERIAVLSVNRISDLNSNPRFNLTFINYGKIDVSINTIYINNVNIGSFSMSKEITEYLDINYIVTEYQISSTGEYRIILVSNRGVIIAYTWKN
jgi:hypothetical protein